MTHFSAMSGLDDRPENYHTVVYELEQRGGMTLVSLSQDGNDSDEAKEQSQSTGRRSSPVSRRRSRAANPPGAVRGSAYPLAVKVLGIDPGTAACGYGIVHESDGRLQALVHGCWTTGARERPEHRLRTIFDGVGELIAEHEPDAVALEESFVGADARIALFVGQARGAALVAAATRGVACTEYAPARVKQAVCGYGRADKGQVSRMVRMLLSLSAEPATSHEADALAVAICHVSMPPLARIAS